VVAASRDREMGNIAIAVHTWFYLLERRLLKQSAFLYDREELWCPSYYHRNNASTDAGIASQWPT